MESENGLLPEGRKLAEVAGGSMKGFDQLAPKGLQAHKKVKASKVRKAHKQQWKAPVQKAVKPSKKAAKPTKAAKAANQRKLNSIEGQAANADQALAQSSSQQNMDNGLTQANVSQKIQDKSLALKAKPVKSQVASQDRALKAYKSHSKRRHRVAAVHTRRHRRNKSHAKGRVAKRHNSRSKRRRAHTKKAHAKKRVAKTKKHAKRKTRRAAGKVKKAVSKKAIHGKPQAHKLKDVPVNKDNEKLADDAINSNAAAPQQKEAPKMTERKLLDLPSQNEFYEQIVSNYYPTI